MIRSTLNAFCAMTLLFSTGAVALADSNTTTTTSTTNTSNTSPSSSLNSKDSASNTASNSLWSSRALDLTQDLKSGPCSDDIKNKCSDITTGDGRVAACLKSHEDKISTECRQYFEAKQQNWQTEIQTNLQAKIHSDMKTKLHETPQACHSDAQKFCSQALFGQGQITSCLGEHRNQLSKSCKKQAKAWVG